MPSMGHLSKLFDSQASQYAKYRPTYPKELYHLVFSLADLNEYGTAVDLATGSGQAASQLAQKFRKVIGIDPNQNMLDQVIRCTHHGAFALPESPTS